MPASSRIATRPDQSHVISAWSTFFHAYSEHWLLLALTVGLTLIGIVLGESLSGSMLPFLLRKVGLDPATSSAPFVATPVDMSGLVIYFSVAAAILHGTLLQSVLLQDWLFNTGMQL